MDKKVYREIHRKAKNFRRKKLLEMIEKKKKGESTDDEFFFLKAWRFMFKNAF